jgi:mono/diheme cytochrome c family protein
LDWLSQWRSGDEIARTQVKEKEISGMKRVTSAVAGLVLSSAIVFGADAAAGKAVYDKACKSCHGADGAPNAKIAAMMKVEMRHLGSKEVQAMSEAEHKKIVTDGKGKMKPIKTVSGADVDNVVAYVHTLKQ